MPRRIGWLSGLCLMTLIAAGAGAQEPPPVAPVATPPPFDAWLTELRAEALSRGIRQDLVDAALNGLEPVEQILERDRTQAEFALDLDAYLRRRLTRAIITMAQTMHARHRTLLQAISQQYGVSSRVIIAVWGLESNFGRFAGVRPTIPALATLAYNPRRAALFRKELFHALEIVNRGDIELENLKGSWAGALGQPQFMPSSYLEYAQDFDGDGRRDIWKSHGDVFASVAFYLQKHGWSERTIWGREVRIPRDAKAALDAVPLRDAGCRAVRLMTVPKPLDEWRRMGLRTADHQPLPTGSLPGSIVRAGSRLFLVYANYEAILGYNCAHSYALSVALLADRLR
jgi:membrane-bound lytic murein transglycosylase B